MGDPPLLRVGSQVMRADPPCMVMGHLQRPCFGTRKTIGVKEVHLITNNLAVR